MSPILVTLTSCSDSDFERSIVSLKENKPDGVNPNSNDIDHYVRKNEGKIRWFSADCVRPTFKIIQAIAECLKYQQKLLDSPPGGGGALPYKPIRDVPFFRVSFFSINS